MTDPIALSADDQSVQAHLASLGLALEQATRTAKVAAMRRAIVEQFPEARLASFEEVVTYPTSTVRLVEVLGRAGAVIASEPELDNEDDFTFASDDEADEALDKSVVVGGRAWTLDLLAPPTGDDFTGVQQFVRALGAQESAALLAALQEASGE